MMSCKYVKVSGPRKTKLLAIKNVRFYKWHSKVHHKSEFLHLADCVSITFELQKRDTKNDTITQHCSHENLLCPVRVWARIIQRIRSYPSSTHNTTVIFFLHNDHTQHHFTGPELLSWLQLATTTVGEEKLGVSADQTGLHSARSGAAMAMYLAAVSVFTIMLLGRWPSNAFLRYIWKQVKEFSAGISSKMIQNEHFFTIPLASNKDFEKPSPPPICLSSKINNGHDFRGTIRPLASVFHWISLQLV